MTQRDVGGGFGQKMFVYREECAVALASYLLGRPVKWIEDRRENLLSAGHSRNEYAHVRMAVDGDGVIQAITADAKADVGTYAVCPAAIDPMLVPGPYKIPRYGFGMEMSWTNTMGKAAYRGPWMFETTAREVAMDYVAHEIGLDPAEFRRRNLLSASDLPFTAPTGNVFQEITPRETLEQALEILDYDAFRKEQATALTAGRYLGVGICAYVEPTSMGTNTLASEAATVKIDASRARGGLPRHHLTRSERRDDHGPDRRRPPRRRRTTTSPSCRPTRSRRPTAPAPEGAARPWWQAERRARRPSRCARRS